MWSTHDYILWLVIISVPFFYFRERIVRATQEIGSLLELYAIVLALIFFLFPNYSEEVQFKHNLLTINCLNAGDAETLFIKAEGQHWQLNDRYATDFYKNNWARILSGLPGEQVSAYLSVVSNMDITNRLIDNAQQNIGTYGSIGGQKAIDEVLGQMNSQVALSGAGVIQEFKTLSITEAVCRNLVASKEWPTRGSSAFIYSFPGN